MTKTLFFSLEEGQKWLLLRRPLGAPPSLRHSSLPISCLLPPFVSLLLLLQLQTTPTQAAAEGEVKASA